MPTSWGLRDIANKQRLIHKNINPLKLVEAAVQDEKERRANRLVDLQHPLETDK